MNTLQTKITNNYKKISHFIFTYLIFFVALVLALFIFRKTISQNTTVDIIQIDTIPLIKETQLIAEFSKYFKHNIQNNDLEIKILQWEFQTDQGFIQSINNLITYKGFIVARYFNIYNTIPIKPLNYFSGNDYDISELQNFINNFIFTKKFTITKSFVREQLPIVKWLVEDFNLSCLFETKFSKATCDHYLNDFLRTFFVYTISTDYSGLKRIFTTIKGNPLQKKAMCDWLSKYFLYTNNQNNVIQELFSMCGQTYLDVFKRTILFIEIQKALENQSFEKIVYKDILLNEYKLFSYQQQIYQDFLINKSDTYKISIYLDFVTELLKKNAIDPFYYDEIYRYNNYYLLPALEKVAYQLNSFNKDLWSSTISSLLTTIRTLNDWDPMFGFSWLALEIQNQSLILENNILTWTKTTITQTEKIKNKLKSISYMTIEKQNILETGIDIISYITFFFPTKNEVIKSHIVMEYQNDMLLVKSIELENRPEMNEVIKNLLLIQNFSIEELYSYISKNLLFYEQINDPITTNIDVCKEVNSLNLSWFVSCTPTTTIFEQNTVRYVFSFKNGSITNITISDKTLENLIKSSYSTIISNTYTLGRTIQAILSYKPPIEKHEGTKNAIFVFEKIQQYMGIKTNDIADSSWIILIDISVWWINFVANFTLNNNTLGPWYFKDIRVNGKPYPIQNLNLPLDDAHQNTINSFIRDPLMAIKDLDLTARQNYNEFIK